MWDFEALFSPHAAVLKDVSLDFGQLRQIFANFYGLHHREIPPEFSARDLLSMAIERGWVVRTADGKYKIEQS